MLYQVFDRNLLNVRVRLIAACALLMWSGVKGQEIALPGAPGEQLIGIPARENNFTTFSRKAGEGGPLWEKYNPGLSDHPDAGYIAPEQPVPGAIEVIGRRTETSRYYVDAGNPSRVFSQSAYGALHYRRDGKWLVIDPRLSPRSRYILEAPRQPEPVGFDLEKGRSYIKTAGGTFSFNNWKLYGRNKDGAKVLLASAGWKSHTAGDDGVLVKEIFPGIDAEMAVDRGRVKTNLVVRKWDYPAYDEYLFEDTYSHENGISLRFADRRSARRGTGKVILSAGDRELASIEKAVAYTKSGDGTVVALPYELSGASQAISLPGNVLAMLVASGPFVIDPLVTGNASELIHAAPLNSYNHADCSSGFAEGCSYSWKLSVPGGITVSNLLFSARIETLAPCTRDKMFFRYQVGSDSCGRRIRWETLDKPPTPGITGGEVYTTDSYNSCIQPACEESFTDIRLSIIRTCMGEEGCGSECVRGIGPFIVTVEGYTLDMEFYKVLPGPQICYGEEVELIAKGAFGIPGYAYQWAPGSLRGDTVRVKPEATTRYTVSLTDACNTTITRTLDVEVSSPAKMDTLEQSDCGIVAYRGVNYSRNQVLEEKIAGRWGCDSIIRTVNIVVHPLDPKEERLSFTGCEYVEFEGARYSASTVLEDTFKSGFGCDSVYRTVNITIETFEMDLISSLHPDSLFIGESINLQARSNRDHFRVISWAPPDILTDQTAFSQQISVPGDITFTVYGETDDGCTDSASLRLAGREIPRYTIYPSSFTPNGDGNNDHWTPVKAIDQLEVWVYNRWGECVYHSTEHDHRWDGTYKGKKVPSGAYAYRFVAYGRFEFNGVVNVVY